MAYKSGEDVIINLTPEIEGFGSFVDASNYEPILEPELVTVPEVEVLEVPDVIDLREPSDVTPLVAEVQAIIDLRDTEPTDQIEINVEAKHPETLRRHRIGREILRSTVRVTKTLGSAVLLASGIALSVVTAPYVYGLKDAKEAPAVTAPPSTVVEDEAPEIPPTTEVPITITTAAPETTTTTEPSFDPVIGETIGEFAFPGQCNYSVEFVAYAESENARQENGGLVGTGAAVIDQLIPDPSPDGVCPAVEEQELRWEAEKGLDYTTRDQLDGNNYLAIGGYPIADNGDYISVRPGMEGVSILSAHRKTRSAANANNALLQPGDPAVFTRDDEVVLNYVVIENKQLPDNESPEDVLTIRNYTHPDFNSIVAIYGCSDVNGNSGSGDYRTVTYLGLTDNKA